MSISAGKKAGPVVTEVINAAIRVLMEDREATGIKAVIVITVLDDLSSCMASTIMDRDMIKHFLAGEFERMNDPVLAKARLMEGDTGRDVTRQ